MRIGCNLLTIFPGFLHVVVTRVKVLFASLRERSSKNFTSIGTVCLPERKEGVSSKQP